MTSAHQFLDKFTVSEPTPVLYVQLEGEPNDTQDRLIKMSKHTPLDPANLKIFYSEPLSLEDEGEAKRFIEDVEIFPIKPKVIILDGFYLSFNGSLSDDSVIRKVIGNLRRIKNYFDCTLIIVHHTHKVRMTDGGDVMDEGDNAVFGSQFLRAWPDHILHLKVQKNSDVRELKCATQRSGAIELSIKMKLMQPDPLYFQVIDEVPSGTVMNTWKDRILKYLDIAIIGGARGSEIMNDVGVPKATFFRAIGELIESQDVYKDGVGRSTLYRSTKKKEEI